MERIAADPRKGQASYFDIVVNGKVNEAGAWYYPDPAADDIKNYVHSGRV